MEKGVSVCVWGGGAKGVIDFDSLAISSWDFRFFRNINTFL